MSDGAYLQLLKRRLPWISFAVDSFWSWVLTTVAFIQLAILIGLVHCLGVFFESWKVKYEVSEETLIWVQSAYYGSLFLFGVLVVSFVKLVPGQICLVAAATVNCACFLITAYTGMWVCELWAGDLRVCVYMHRITGVVQWLVSGLQWSSSARQSLAGQQRALSE